MANPSWGYWRGLADDGGRGPIGSLRTKSKNLGDGGWCLACLKNGFYSWIDTRYEKIRCLRCGQLRPEISLKDQV